MKMKTEVMRKIVENFKRQQKRYQEKTSPEIT